MYGKISRVTNNNKRELGCIQLKPEEMQKNGLRKWTNNQGKDKKGGKSIKRKDDKKYKNKVVEINPNISVVIININGLKKNS